MNDSLKSEFSYLLKSEDGFVLRELRASNGKTYYYVVHDDGSCRGEGYIAFNNGVKLYHKCVGCGKVWPDALTATLKLLL